MTMTDDQKVMMAYGILRMTIDEIAKMKGQDYRGDGETLSDAVALAKKAQKAVDSIIGEMTK